MKSAIWATLLLLTGMANAQQTLVAEKAAPSASSAFSASAFTASAFSASAVMETSSRERFLAAGGAPQAPAPRFWGLENKVDFSIFAGQLAVDAITTQHGLANGFRETNPIAAPFVNRGAAGAAAASALGLGAGVGVAYVLHRTHHYKAEHMAVRLMLAGEGAVVARNVALLR
jgi:hypothetical protein